MKRTIRVEVAPGMFSSEKYASFRAGDRNYVLFVDEANLHGNFLEVYVVEEVGDDVIVDLPGETLASGGRVRVPKTLIQAA